MESATDKELWQKAKDDDYVIVTRDADFQELSLVWGQPPKVIRLKTLNQTRVATLKLLIESRDVITESLQDRDLAAIEIVT
jgi:predicted nuclease of predicted toxin-antitoxin system